MNYARIYELCKKYGKIERMKIKIEKDPMKLGQESCYVLYSNSTSAYQAQHNLNNTTREQRKICCRLLNRRNFVESDRDYIPEEDYDITLMKEIITQKIDKQPIYFVAFFRERQEI